MKSTGKLALGVGGAAFCAAWLLTPGMPPLTSSSTADAATQSTQSVPTAHPAEPVSTEAQKAANTARLEANMSPAERAQATYCDAHPQTASPADMNNAELAVQRVITQEARDPGSVRFKYMQFVVLDHGLCGQVKYVCGKVTGKNGFGGYSGFQRYFFTTSGPHRGEGKIGISKREELAKCGNQIDVGSIDADGDDPGNTASDSERQSAR